MWKSIFGRTGENDNYGGWKGESFLWEKLSEIQDLICLTGNLYGAVNEYEEVLDYALQRLNNCAPHSRYFQWWVRRANFLQKNIKGSFIGPKKSYNRIGASCIIQI